MRTRGVAESVNSNGIALAKTWRRTAGGGQGREGFMCAGKTAQGPGEKMFAGMLHGNDSCIFALTCRRRQSEERFSSLVEAPLFYTQCGAAKTVKRLQIERAPPQFLPAVITHPVAPGISR